MNCDYELIGTDGDGLHRLRCRFCMDRRSSKYKTVRRKCPKRQQEKPPAGLGDNVSKALAFVGVTKERVSAWVGRECNCPERIAKLNQLGEWAGCALADGTEAARQKLLTLLGK